MSDGLEAGGTHRRAAAGLDVHFVGSADVDLREHPGGRIGLSPSGNQLGKALALRDTHRPRALPFDPATELRERGDVPVEMAHTGDRGGA